MLHGHNIVNIIPRFHIITHSQREELWFWYKTAPAPAADASELRNRRQYKNSAYSQQSGPISHIVWTD